MASLRTKNKSQCFSSFVTDELVQLSKGFIYKINLKKTAIATIGDKKFSSMGKSSQHPPPDDIHVHVVSPNLLPTYDKFVVNAWLPRYVMEMRNRVGSCYTPSTLYQLLGGILRHVRKKMLPKLFGQARS